MENHVNLNTTILQCNPILKNYNIQLFRVDGQYYRYDTEWLVNWYYTSINPHIDNLTFEIHGSLHSTFPNPEHLSVKIKDMNGNYITPMLHISVDENNNPYIQELFGHGIKKQNKYKKLTKYKKKNIKKQTKYKIKNKHY